MSDAAELVEGPGNNSSSTTNASSSKVRGLIGPMSCCDDPLSGGVSINADSCEGGARAVNEEHKEEACAEGMEATTESVGFRPRVSRPRIRARRSVLQTEDDSLDTDAITSAIGVDSVAAHGAADMESL